MLAPMTPGYDMTKPLGKRRPKVMERMPDHPRGSFQLDEQKFRESTEPNERWLERGVGRWYLAAGYSLLGAVAVIVAGMLLTIALAFPGMLIGVMIFAMIAAMQHSGAPKN